MFFYLPEKDFKKTTNHFTIPYDTCSPKLRFHFQDDNTDQIDICRSELGFRTILRFGIEIQNEQTKENLLLSMTSPFSGFWRAYAWQALF